MTIAELWSIMPLLIIAAGALAVLLLGAVMPGRYGTTVGVVTLAGSILWCLQAPPGTAATLGVLLSPIGRFFTGLFSLTAALVLLLSHDYNARRGIRGEEYPATVLFAAFGMAVLSAATNLLILFLGLEGLTFAFYFLVAIDREKEESGEAGLKYLLLGAVSAAFIAFGIALIYAGTGTLEIVPAMKALSSGGKIDPLLLGGAGFILAGMAFKISLVPAHLWTPDVYEGASAPVVAFLSTSSKGAAVVFMLLLVTGTGPIDALRAPLWGLSLLSMVVGNLAALIQKNIKRMLGYSAVAQMGYVTLALLSGGEGYRAAVFYLVAYTAMNLAAFGVIASLTGEEEPGDLNDFRGLGYSSPFQGGVLALAMFALAGIPPTAGFVGKFLIFSAAIRGGEVTLAVIGIMTAVVSVFYYLRVVVNLYMYPAEEAVARNSGTVIETFSLAVISLVTVILGLYPGPLLGIVGSLFR